MSEELTVEQRLAALRVPFPDAVVGSLPRGGTMLSFVGHATVTDRLLSVDPLWSWEPFAISEDGRPLIHVRGTQAILWIRLTICGVSRVGVGIASAEKPECEKELISDAIRNAAMRFGVALDLWAKDGLESDMEPPPRPPWEVLGYADESDLLDTVTLIQELSTQLPEDQRAVLSERKRELGAAWPPSAAHAELLTSALYDALAASDGVVVESVDTELV